MQIFNLLTKAAKNLNDDWLVLRLWGFRLFGQKIGAALSRQQWKLFLVAVLVFDGIIVLKPSSVIYCKYFILQTI